MADNFVIENGVLKECRTGQESLVLPSGIVQIGESFEDNQGLTVFGEENISLHELVIPEGVKSIENHAFNHSHLTRITFPESLEKIGANAFLKGYNYQTLAIDDALRTLRFPKNLKIIEAGAFDSCGLDYAFVSENTIVECDAFPEDCRVFVEKNDGNITEVADLSLMEFSDDAEAQENAKAECKANANESKNRTDISDNLKSLLNMMEKSYDNFDEENRYVEITGVKNTALETYDLSPIYKDAKTTFCSKIGSYAFSNCTRMKAIIIPETVENIEDNAFDGTPLKLAKVHESLQYLIEETNPFPKDCEIEYFD